MQFRNKQYRSKLYTFTPIGVHIVTVRCPAKVQLKTIRPIITLVTYSFLSLLKWSKHEGTLTFHAPLFESFTLHLAPQFVKISVSISQNKSILGIRELSSQIQGPVTQTLPESQHTLGDSQKLFFYRILWKLINISKWTSLLEQTSIVVNNCSYFQRTIFLCFVNSR